MNIENILVLAPHTDDGELGLGGTISKYIEEGKNVYYAAFSTADKSVPEGFQRTFLQQRSAVLLESLVYLQRTYTSTITRYAN